MSDEQQPLMTFPCEFSIKVMGDNIDDYALQVLSIAQKHAPEIDHDCITTRESKNGKYLAVTVTLVAQSREQLDSIYIELNAHEQTKMAL